MMMMMVIIEPTVKPLKGNYKYYTSASLIN